MVFMARFMGSLTALLVLASMMPVFTEGLPKASYTKGIVSSILWSIDLPLYWKWWNRKGVNYLYSSQLIDVWLLFFLISTTINICIHILVDFLRKSELEFERIHGAARPTTVKVGEAYMHGEVMIGMDIGRLRIVSIFNVTFKHVYVWFLWMALIQMCFYPNQTLHRWSITGKRSIRWRTRKRKLLKTMPKRKTMEKLASLQRTSTWDSSSLSQSHSSSLSAIWSYRWNPFKH